MAHGGIAFEQLDSDGDGLVSRKDLHLAARRLRWHWREAPLYAVLDLLSLLRPFTPREFDETVKEMTDDPRGPYGRVLHRAWPLYRSPGSIGGGREKRRGPVGIGDEDPEGASSWMGGGRRLRSCAGDAAAEACQRFFEGCRPLSLSARSAVLLVIDPQVAFTEGAWMRSIGAEADVDTVPIRLAFEACGALLTHLAKPVEAAFTRCPFPPDSYGWDRRLAEGLESERPYFLKPGNNAFLPPANGFAQWLEGCIHREKTTLVIGGCTLNSCVRVTAAQVQARYGGRPFQVVVDLSLCGARLRNYLPSPRYGGLSAVSWTISEMEDAGIAVVRQVRWK